MLQSSVSKFRLIKTNHHCQECGEPLYTNELNTAIEVCRNCGQRAIEEKNKEIEQWGVSLLKKQNTYDVLKRKSILADDSLKTVSFENYDVTNREQDHAIYKAKSIANDYLDGRNYNSFLQGKPGTGKSHLAMSILKFVNENSNPYRSCLFISLDEVSRKIRQNYGNQSEGITEGEVIDIVSKVDVLVVDDLGENREV